MKPKKAIKRGGRSKNSKARNQNEKARKMFILGANAAGLFNKLESFYRNVSTFNPGVFFIQESKAKRKNKIKLNNYTGCPEKNAPQILLNFSGYKHARKLGHNSLERWDP